MRRRDDNSYVASESKASMDADTSGDPKREDPKAAGVMPAYSDFGGLRQTIGERRSAAERRRDEARERWRRRIEEADNASMAFAETMKPADTRREQRNLHILALSQALGSLIGTGIGGAIGFGRRGEGYVEPAMGLEWRALDRAEKLRQQGVNQEREYRGYMGRMLADIAAQKAQRAGREADDAEKELLRLDNAEVALLKQQLAAQVRAAQDQQRQQAQAAAEAQRQANRETLEQKRQQNRITLKRTPSAGSKGAVASDPDVVRLKALFLPQEKTTTTTGRRGTQKTTAPYTSYPKEVAAAAEALAAQVAPVARKYRLSDYDILGLQRAMEKTPELGADWSMVEAALAQGVGVDDIIDYIYRSK